jgi:pyruvate formate lyase activating enzyme
MINAAFGGETVRILGLQKLTLLDFPGVVSCIIFTKGCNFRCPFCHNASLVTESNGEEINEDEILTFLKERKKILDGVVITGGEPLIHPDIKDFLKKIKEMGYLIKLDTNGTNPKMLKQIVKEKLVDYVAMDVKNSVEEYKKASGTDGFSEEILQSVEFLLTDVVDYEFRSTLVRGIHTKESIMAMANLIKGAKKYYLQQYKDSGDILNPGGLSAFSDDEMKEFLAEISPVIPSSHIR